MSWAVSIGLLKLYYTLLRTEKRIFHAFPLFFDKIEIFKIWSSICETIYTFYSFKLVFIPFNEYYDDNSPKIISYVREKQKAILGFGQDFRS